MTITLIPPLMRALDDLLFQALLLLILVLWCVPLLAAGAVLSIPVGLYKLAVWLGWCEAA